MAFEAVTVSANDHDEDTTRAGGPDRFHNQDRQSPESLGAQWMALAGLRQRPLEGGRASLEAMATNPPNILLASNYRSGQLSQGQRWLDHPLIARLPSRRMATDGRAWTCGGPMMIGEIERLRRLVR